MNKGYINKNPRVDANYFRGISSMANTVLMADGQWDAFLPPDDRQYTRYGDTFACVTFSAINCIEMLLNQMGATGDFSQRFTAKQDGTIPGYGNDFFTVARCIETNGLLDEALWPLPIDLPLDQFYEPYPPEFAGKALQLLKTYAINDQYVPTDVDSLKSALRFGPVQVAIFAYGPKVGDTFHFSPNPADHAIALYGYVDGQYWKAWDSEQGQIKLSWDTKFWAAQQFSVTKVKSMFNFLDGYLYQLVEGVGGFLLYTAGKLYHDDLAKVLASWEVRNGGNTTGKVGTLVLNDLNGITLYNLKGEVVNL